MVKKFFWQKIGDYEVRLTSAAVEAIERESLSSPQVETGGVIAGRGNFLDNNLVLTDASLPGPNAIRKRHFFQRDHLFCQKFLDDVAADSNGERDYLGEWHKHFEIDPKPSATDLGTLTRIARNANYHVSVPLMLIIGISNLKESLRIFAVFNDGSFQKIKWSII
jgi:integrative and conjugative element protein (TIGR02256 family)